MLTGDILRLSARRHPGKTAIIANDRALTYRELDLASNRFANAALGLGLGKGEFILVMSPNVIEYPIIHYGAARSGAILVHVSPLAGSAELEHILAKLAPRLIVVDESVQDKLQDCLGDTDPQRRVVVVGTSRHPGSLTLAQFWRGAGQSHPRVAIDEDEPFAMTFTGGTTGLPKGALVSHKSRFVSAYATAMEHGIQRDDVVAVVTPLYHVVSMLIWMQAGLLMGATCVVQRKWDVAEFERLALRHGITSVFVVPLQLRAMLASDQVGEPPYAALRQIGCGGAPLSAETKSECLAKLPHVALNDHYGQSETGLLTILNANRHRDKLDSVGQAAVGVELDVVDAAGNPVGSGETGAIVARGDFVFSGYYDNEPENSLYFQGQDGWGWTGDLGRIDADGFLTIVGRSKEMIVSGGVNIYPREVERVLEECAGVLECAVFGVPDEKWGETLVACIVSREQMLTDQDVIAYCESRIARVKRPGYVWFVDEIPKTPSGKTQKNKLKQAFMASAHYQPEKDQPSSRP